MEQCPPAPKKQRIDMPRAGSLRPKQLFGKNLPRPDPNAFPIENGPVSTVSGLDLAKASRAEEAAFPATKNYWLGLW